MEVYLDLLVLMNIVFNMVLLLLTGKVMQMKMSFFRLLFAALVGSLCTCGYYLFFWLFPTKPSLGRMNQMLLLCGLRFVIAAVMLLLAFGVKKRKQWFFSFFVLYTVSFLLEGLFRYLQQVTKRILPAHFPLFSLLGMALFAILFVYRLIRLLKEREKSKWCSHPVLLCVGKKKACGRGLMDSGNRLFEPITHKPVVVVERGLLLENNISEPRDGYFAIPFHAVGTQHGILKGFLADELHILNEDGEKISQKVMIGIYEGKLSVRGDYQILLHPDM